MKQRRKTGLEVKILASVSFSFWRVWFHLTSVSMRRAHWQLFVSNKQLVSCCRSSSGT